MSPDNFKKTSSLRSRAIANEEALDERESPQPEQDLSLVEKIADEHAEYAMGTIASVDLGYYIQRIAFHISSVLANKANEASERAKLEESIHAKFIEHVEVMKGHIND